MLLEDAKDGDILIVKPLESRIDASIASDFKEKMLHWINDGNIRIILDLSQVDFIDSSGLAAIVSSLKAMPKQGTLVICGLTEAVMNLFRLTRMNRVFQIYSSQDDALESLKN